MPLGLLIPLIAPLITEGIKWLWNSLGGAIPPKLVPVVSAVAGAVCTIVGSLTGVDLGVSPIEGGLLGLAGTGVHQMKVQPMKCAAMALLALILAGCANTTAASSATAHGVIDAVCTVAHSGVDLAFGPIEDVQADATAIVDGAKSVVK
jgi:hypothetical protein